MENERELQDFLRAAHPMRTEGAKPLKEVIISLKDHFPPLRDENFPRSTVSDIDCVVSDLSRIIAAMKIHRNNLSPVHSLPDDILSLIFRYFCFGDSPARIYAVSSWAMIMFVCRRWHCLIMHDAFLWSFLDLSRISYSARAFQVVDTQLERSRDHPLSVAHLRDKSSGGIYDYELRRQSHRIVSLCLRSLSKDVMAEVFTTFSGEHLPPLHTLKLETNAYEDGFCLPDAFLQLPSLRRLVIEDAITFSVVLLPSALVELRLTGALRPATFSVGLLLRQMKHMSNLEDFDVSLYSFIPDDAMHDTILVPRLKTLSLLTDIKAIAIFLAAMRIPSTSDIHIQCTGRTTSASLVSELIFSRLHRRIRPRGVRLLKLGTPSSYSDTLDLSVAGFDHTDLTRISSSVPYDYSMASLLFTFFYGSAKVRNRIFRRLFRTVGAETTVLHIRNLIDHSGQLTEGWWKIALLSLPSLADVYLDADYMTMVNFCNAYIRLLETHPKSFPRLKGIHVRAKVRPPIVDVEEVEEEEMMLRMIPLRSAVGLLKLARHLQEVGCQIPLVTVYEDYHHWPGALPMRELASYVGRLEYGNGEVYDYELLKAASEAGRARFLTMRPNIQFPPDPEFDD